MDKIKSFFKSVIGFFARNTGALTTAAVIAETATGNAELIPLTETAGKAVQAGAEVLSKVE